MQRTNLQEKKKKEKNHNLRVIISEKLHVTLCMQLSNLTILDIDRLNRDMSIHN